MMAKLPCWQMCNLIHGYHKCVCVNVRARIDLNRVEMEAEMLSNTNVARAHGQDCDKFAFIHLLWITHWINHSVYRACTTWLLFHLFKEWLTCILISHSSKNHQIREWIECHVRNWTKQRCLQSPRRVQRKSIKRPRVRGSDLIRLTRSQSTKQAAIRSFYSNSSWTTRSKDLARSLSWYFRTVPWLAL